ncbi:MAG: TerD family protein [Alphaproteobacteria bacterium]
MTDIFDRSLDDVNVEISDNKVEKGADVNITAKDPTMSSVVIAAGWKASSFHSSDLDIDVSCFLLDKNDKTRVNEDFIFYNNEMDIDESVVHNGDNLTGAGEGDDETISIDLKKIPYDIFKVMFVLSIYRGEEKDQQMSNVRNGYVRLINASNGQELLRYDISPEVADSQGETAMRVVSLNREGPKWHFYALGELVKGGLAQVATDYDIIVHKG